MLCGREHDVSLWARDPAVATAINRDRRNPKYLSESALPTSVRATADLDEALSGKELVVLAVPSHGLRDVVSEGLPSIAPGALLVSTAKGIETETGLLVHQMLAEVLPEEHHPRIVALSGPSFAREIAEEKPTVVTVACREEPYAISVQSMLSCPWFRCYSHTDIVGVELGGAMKNVIAIAVGMCDGMEAGTNARAAVMTRGLAEITKLGIRLGAEPTTFLGLAGMGDLVLTCTGDLSRNRRVGLELGLGRSLPEILEGMGQVAEGVKTTQAVCRLAARLGVEMPIAELVRGVIDGELKPADAGAALMTRQLRSERDDYQA